MKLRMLGYNSPRDERLMGVGIGDGVGILESELCGEAAVQQGARREMDGQEETLQ